MDTVQSETRFMCMPAPAVGGPIPSPSDHPWRPTKTPLHRAAHFYALRTVFQTPLPRSRRRTGNRKVLLMPKNMFQRPQQVARNNNVPRHGAPLPVRKAEARKVVQPREQTLRLPTLEALLGKRH